MSGDSQFRDRQVRDKVADLVSGIAPLANEALRVPGSDGRVTVGINDREKMNFRNFAEWLREARGQDIVQNTPQSRNMATQLGYTAANLGGRSARAWYNRAFADDAMQELFGRGESSTSFAIMFSFFCLRRAVC